MQSKTPRSGASVPTAIVHQSHTSHCCRVSRAVGGKILLAGVWSGSRTRRRVRSSLSHLVVQVSSASRDGFFHRQQDGGRDSSALQADFPWFASARDLLTPRPPRRHGEAM
ncbi:hypothetical protein LX36DRAFT_255359 [Colletotrichum falcatum]|nr:hypothetical protein LX36DRAFT_255359 [Colletotrichum falcatum]